MTVNSETYLNEVTEFENKQEITSTADNQAGHLTKGMKDLDLAQYQQTLEDNKVRCPKDGGTKDVTQEPERQPSY